MADYTVGISGSTTLMIRDTGGWVEFWIRTGPSTWNNDQQYSFFANGGFSGTRKFRMLRGGNWQFVSSVYVGYDQTVTFTIIGSGLGFPTYSFNQHIQRSTVPQPPTLLSVIPVSSSEFDVDFLGNSDGGSAIVEWQIGYGSSSNGPSNIVGWFGGDAIVGGFYSGQRIYFWVRARNALGWSEWSNRGEGVTWQTPAALTEVVFSDVRQKTVGVRYIFSKRQNDPPTLEAEFKYGRDITGVVIDGTAIIDEDVEYLNNLDPGKTYYFWGRARNSVGWGPWSPSASFVILIAGARVLADGQWKRAVPYVKSGGVWKVAEPWVKSAGVWNRTAQ